MPPDSGCQPGCGAIGKLSTAPQGGTRVGPTDRPRPPHSPQDHPPDALFPFWECRRSTGAQPGSQHLALGGLGDLDPHSPGPWSSWPTSLGRPRGWHDSNAHTLALKLAASGAGRPAVCQRTCSMWTSHPPASQGPVLSETCEEAPGVARVGGLAQCPGRSLAQLTGGAYRAPTSWLRLS